MQQIKEVNEEEKGLKYDSDHSEQLWDADSSNNEWESEEEGKYHLISEINFFYVLLINFTCFRNYAFRYEWGKVRKLTDIELTKIYPKEFSECFNDLNNELPTIQKFQLLSKKIILHFYIQERQLDQEPQNLRMEAANKEKSGGKKKKEKSLK